SDRDGTLSTTLGLTYFSGASAHTPLWFLARLDCWHSLRRALHATWISSDSNISCMAQPCGPGAEEDTVPRKSPAHKRAGADLESSMLVRAALLSVAVFACAMGVGPALAEAGPAQVPNQLQGAGT